MDKPTAEMISQNYLEVVAAPDFEEGTIPILAKRANLRIVHIKGIENLVYYKNARFVEFKSLMDGGLIVQQSALNRIQSSADFILPSVEYKGKTYTIARKPTNEEYVDMLFGWQVEQGITSNSVIYVKNGVTVGIGTGEQDRVGVAEIAIYKAYTKYADAVCFKHHGMPFKDLEVLVRKGEKDQSLIDDIDSETKENLGGLMGSTMVSDAFFPFRDGVDVAIREGVRAIVQPGGSLRDFEVIEACNEADPQVTMVFTGQRAFKH
jgi:phosphoribosylaminoimidazolecarboxamide formyltransferase/IMP cyclohydrolase